MWGKIVGGLVGSWGGPWGLLVGVFIGHMWDRHAVRAEFVSRARNRHEDEFHIGGSMDQVAFAVGVIVLGAKMAKADGIVTRAEVDAFKRVFHIPPEQEKALGRMFDQAKQEAQGFEPHARRLATLFRMRPFVLEELLTGLILVAKADSNDISPAEYDFLREVARIFGFTQNTFERLLASAGARGADSPMPADDPYTILGVHRDAGADQIKAAYRKLIREHHPDKLMASGVPKEFIDQATETMKRVNAAYAAVCKERGIT